MNERAPYARRQPIAPIQPIAEDSEDMDPDIKKDLEAGTVIKVWYLPHVDRYKASCGMLLVSGDTLEEVWRMLTTRRRPSHVQILSQARGAWKKRNINSGDDHE